MIELDLSPLRETALRMLDMLLPAALNGDEPAGLCGDAAAAVDGDAAA